MNRIRKLRVRWTTLLSVVALTGASATRAAQTAKSAATIRPEVVMFVNEDEVTVDEFTLLMRMKTAEAFQRFRLSAGSVADDSTWAQTLDGQTLIDFLRQAAADELVAIKCEQQVARRAGVKTRSFAELIADLAEENERRDIARAASHPLPGRMKFGLADYYQQYRNHLGLEVRRRLQLPSADLEEALEERYARRRDSFRKPDTVKIAFETVEGESPDAATPLRGSLEIEEESYRLDDDFHIAMRVAASKLAQGESSSPVRIAGRTYVVRCLGRRANGHTPLQEVRGTLLGEHAIEQFADSVAKARRGAKVAIDATAYGRTHPTPPSPQVTTQ